MIARRAALAALERIVDASGELPAGRAFLSRVDPFVRGRAWRVVRAAHLDALASTHVRGPSADLHAARLAYLTLAGAPQPPEGRDDVEGVAATFESERARRPPMRRWAWSFTALALVVLATLGIVGARSLWPGAPTHDASARAAPPAKGAYAHSGVPMTDETLRRALANDLPDVVIAIDRLARAADPAAADAARRGIEAATARALSADVTKAAGPDVVARLSDVIARARDASAAPPEERAATATALLEATGALDDSIAAVGFAYFVDGDVISDAGSSRKIVSTYSFEVKRVTRFSSGDATIRALELRRIDHLNWANTLLGFSRPELRDALVLLDPVDQELVSTLAPALAEGGSVTLFDVADVHLPARRSDVEARAGALVREEYFSGSGVDPQSGSRLGAMLARRNGLFAGFSKDLAARGLALSAPKALHIDNDYAADLRSYVPGPDLAEVEQLEEKIKDPMLDTAFDAARNLLVASIARHEVQHRLDYARKEPLRMPPSLEHYSGPAEVDGQERRGAVRARAEMSAYLAELSRDERTTKVNLTLVARFLFDRKFQGIAESYAAVVIVEAMAKDLGADAAGPLVVASEIDRERAAATYLELVGRPGEALRASARRVWAASFGEELAPLRQLSE